MKGITIDVRTGAQKLVEDGIPFEPSAPLERIGVNLQEIAELIEVAKKKGWIPKSPSGPT